MAFIVAVTGPTGDIGHFCGSGVGTSPRGRANHRDGAASVRSWPHTVGPARNICRATSPDRDAVDELPADADVVIHLAFIIKGCLREESARVNLEGTRNVFEATVAADRPRRLVYTSSVAVYGYHLDNPVPITEDAPARGSPEHYYSEQKAAVRGRTGRNHHATNRSRFMRARPCIVAGPKAPALAEAMPWNQLPRPGEAGRAGTAVTQAAVPRSRNTAAAGAP